MRRREFIKVLAGSVAVWPVAVRAQPDRLPRIALFMGIADDIEGQRRAEAFRRALQQLGWKEGSNVRIDERWGVADTEVIRATATDRVACVMNPDNPATDFFMGSFETLAPSLGLQPIITHVRNGEEILRALDAFAGKPGIGLVLPPDDTTIVHRKLVVTLAARHQLPAVYSFRVFVAEGGLMSYAIDVVDLFRRSASYVDRILKGEKAGDLPIQAPTKFELTLNLQTAKALGLTVPPSLLARADEVIE